MRVRVERSLASVFRVVSFAGVLSSMLLLGAWADAQTPPENKPPAQGASPAADESVRKVHDQINAYRRSKGLEPLALDPFLTTVASEHSRNMAEGKAEFGHEGFEGRARAIREQVTYSGVAENVGMNMGKPDPESAVVEGWINSPEHLKNIRGEFDLTGIGKAKREDGRIYYTQIFLKRAE